LKRVVGFLIVVILSVACASPLANVAAPRDETDAGNIARDYATWARMFDAPQNVSGFLIALCRLVTTEEQQYLDSEHAQYFVQVYVNPAGAKTIKQEGARKFPEASIIVKEKWAQDAQFKVDASARKPAGLGIMVKVKTGWQYAYVDEKGAVTRDQKQLEHCGACHEGNKERDAVFYPVVFSQ